MEVSLANPTTCNTFTYELLVKLIANSLVVNKKIIIITIILLLITYMQDIYNYVPETNHVSRVYSVAAVLYVQFVLHVMLFRL